jgi:preprotein translocase subunit Sss1
LKIDRKREEREKALEEAKRNRAAGTDILKRLKKPQREVSMVM